MTEAFEIIFMLGAYFIIAVSVMGNVENSIDAYQDNKIKLHSMNIFIHENEKKLILFGFLLWPLFFCFKFGYYIGCGIYKILIDNEYEDRIASWVM